jgi:S1-C subfamily serine protease
MDGVYIQGVNEESAAEEAGLERGDVIVKVNGIPVKSSPELQEQVGLFRPGEKVGVIFLRAGELKSTDVVLKNSSNTTTLGQKRSDKRLASKKTLLKDLGIEARNLNTSEASVSDGILVTKVLRDGLIEPTNMEEDFVITSVNEEPVSNLEDFKTAVVEADGEIVLEGFYKGQDDIFTYIFQKD